MKKIFAALLAAALVMGLTACGGSDSGSKETKSEAAAPAVEGEQGTAGKISVFVPKGYVLNQGSITGADDDDDTRCYIQGETPSMYDYYWIMIQDSEDAAKSNADMTKRSVNSAEDASVVTGEITWTGCSYVYSGSTADYDCGCVYATVDGVVYQVNFCGHALDSAEMMAVLGSIKAA